MLSAVRRYVSLSICVLLSVVVGGLTLQPAPLHAQDKQYALSGYDVTLALQPDGAYDVEETITLDVQRGTFQSMNRRIPLSRIDSLSRISVTSPDATVRDVRVERGDGAATLRWTYPPRSTPASFRVQYRVHGALRTDTGRNVIDWMAVGTGWDVPVRDVDVTVRVPSALDVPRDSLTADPDDASIQADSGGWTVQFAGGDRAPGEGYAVEVAFPARIETPAVGSDDVPSDDMPALHLLGGLLVSVLAVLGFAIARWRRGPSAPEVAAPDRAPAVSLPEAARVLGDARAARMHSALLFDLAQRGHVSLEAEGGSSWTSSPTVRVRTHPDRPNLDAFEEAFLEELARHDTLDDFASGGRSFRSDQRTEVRKRLVRKGWLRDRSGPYWRAVTASLLGLAGTIGIAAAGIAWDVVAAFYLGGASAGVGIGALFLVEPRYAPTEEGLRLRAQLKAFLTDQREQLERLRDEAPDAAAERLLDVLPWLLLDDDVSKGWLDDMQDAFDDADVSVTLPDWLLATDQSSDEAAFIVLMASISHVSSTTSAGTAGAVGGAVGGAGAAGAAGGGGGGAA